jgi:hypothetical protein
MAKSALGKFAIGLPKTDAQRMSKKRGSKKEEGAKPKPSARQHSSWHTYDRQRNANLSKSRGVLDRWIDESMDYWIAGSLSSIIPVIHHSNNPTIHQSIDPSHFPGNSMVL